MKHLRIQYHNNINDISNDWTAMHDTSSSSYFCSLQWHKVVLSFLKKAELTKRLYKIQYFTVLNAGNQVKLIGFFFINRYGSKKRIQFSHILGPSDYYDFVYNGRAIANEDLKEIINTIQKDYKAATISVAMVKENSFLADFLMNDDRILKINLPAVAIQLEENYDTYLQSLSKSVKQNIRTAYNRLKRDDLDYALTILNKTDTPNINFEKLKELYVLRNDFRKEKHNWKVNIFQILNNGFSEPADMFDLNELKQTDFTLGLLKFNNEIAAYFFGFEKNGKIEINRVVINEAFKFYSPGMILFNEFIKIAFENDLKIIDLTNGDEKYKFDLGGEIHNVYNANMSQ
jgi:hypothetical protein